MRFDALDGALADIVDRPCWTAVACERSPILSPTTIHPSSIMSAIRNIREETREHSAGDAVRARPIFEHLTFKVRPTATRRLTAAVASMG